MQACSENGFQRGMRIDHAHGHEKPVRRNSIHAYATVVVFQHFSPSQSDGVVSIGAFVHTLRIRRS